MVSNSSHSFSKILLLTIVVMYFSVELHEAGHWTVLQLFGRGPTMGFAGIVQRWDSPPMQPEHWQKISYEEIGTGWLRIHSLPQSNTEWAIMLLAGQLVPLLLIALGIGVYHRFKDSPFVPLFLMTVFVNGGMGFRRLLGLLQGTKGDLYFLSLHIPVNPTLLTGIFIILQLTGFFWAWQQLSPHNRRRWVIALFLTYLLVIMPLRFVDSYLRQQVNLENPWVLPVLGWSKAVLIVDLIMIFLIIRWWYWSKKRISNKNTT